jgi:hypothetical protein
MKLKILIIILLAVSLLWSDILINTGATVTLDNNARLVIDGSWDNSGTFNSPTGLVTMRGSAAATFSASGDNNFYQLLINKPPTGTFTLNSSMDVNNLLTVTAGSIITGANTIIMGASGYVVASPLMINGNVSGYPVSVGTSAYSNPILGVDLTAGNDIGDLEVLLFITPTGLTEFPTILNKWSLTSTSPPAGSRDLTLSWNLSEDNGIDLNNIQAWRTPDEGTTWFQVGAPTTTSGNPRSITVADVTSLSDWTVGEPIFTSTEEEIDFGVCSQSSSQSQQITITNESLSTISGTAEISLPYSVAIVSDNGDYLLPDSRGLNANDNRTSKQLIDDSRNTLVIPSISASGSVTLQITYNPTLTGIHDDVLLLTFSGTGSPSKEIIVTGTTVATPEIQVTPSSMAFGDVYVGGSSTDQFTIENPGSGVLTGNIITPTGYSVVEATDDVSENGKKDFRQKQIIRNNSSISEVQGNIDSRNTLPFSIDPGITATYDLTISPSGTGDLNGTVTISNNAGANETIAVTGRGVTVVVGTDPASFTKTIQRENSTSDILEISNSSNGTLTYTASISYLDDTRSINTVNPSSVDYWTGTCASGTKTNTSEARCGGNLVVADRETGWMKFDISALPDDAIVYSIEFHGYVNDTNWPYWSITPCLDDPVATDATTLSTNINGSAESALCYNFLDESNTYSVGWKTYSLGGTALNDFENGLEDNWFAVGLAERDDYANYYVNFDGWNETNPPYLEIEYTTPDKNWFTINDAMRLQGSISGSALDEITVDFNSVGISDGSYSANINVASNDPVTPSIDIAVSLTVETPEITVSPLTFDYGYIEVGTTSSQQFTIQNTGNALLDGYITTPSGFSATLATDKDTIIAGISKDKNIQFNENDSSLNELNSRVEKDNDNLFSNSERKSEFEESSRATLYYSVVAGVTNTYNLIFSPVAIADYSATVTISDNCPENDYSLSVTAHGDEPNLDITPASFDVTLTNFATSSEELTLSNTSNIEVNYTAFIYTETVVPTNSALWTGTVNWSTFPDPSEVRGHLDEDGWMMFDISSIPDNATILGAIFHGYVNSSYAPALSITPVTSYPLGTAPITLHNDINAECNYLPYCYIYEPQQLIPTGWYENELTGSAVVDIQAALAQDWFTIGISERTNNPTYFINFDGWDEANPPYINIVYTLPTELDPWLTIDSGTGVSGSIPALDNTVHTMGFDPSLVGDGTYTTNILVVSNDTDNREQLIPVTLTVETPVIVIDPASIDYGDILVGEIFTDQFSIENTGTATLSGSITTPAGYSVVLAGSDNSSLSKKFEPKAKDNRNVLSFDIAVGVTLTYDLTFAPVAVADYNGNVAIAHNALGGSDNIAVTGAGITIELVLNPTSFNESAYEGNTVATALTISNNGTASLNYNGQINYDGSEDPWLTLDGQQTLGGTISASGFYEYNVLFNADGLTPDIYTASINGTSNDPDNPTFSIPVSFTVIQVLDAPDNLTVEVSGNFTVIISWDNVPGSTIYHVYSSSSPDGTFTEETGGVFTAGSRESWSKTYYPSPVPEKLFFKVTADDIVTDNINKKRK